jgi:hypothetical protein
MPRKKLVVPGLCSDCPEGISKFSLVDLDKGDEKRSLCERCFKEQIFALITGNDQGVTFERVGDGPRTAAGTKDSPRGGLQRFLGVYSVRRKATGR